MDRKQRSANTVGLSNEKENKGLIGRAQFPTSFAVTGVVIVCSFTLLNWIENQPLLLLCVCVCLRSLLSKSVSERFIRPRETIQILNWRTGKRLKTIVYTAKENRDYIEYIYKGPRHNIDQNRLHILLCLPYHCE